MSLSFIRLQQLISPTLPIGSFTYSQGMEWAHEFGWIDSANDAHLWIESVMNDAMLYFDLPLLERLYLACQEGDKDQFFYYAQLSQAGRETKELRLEEQQRARAMISVFEKLPGTNHWKHFSDWNEALLKSQLACFAMACCAWNIPLHDALRGYLWSWLENMVMVIVKLIPLGQSEGQKILFTLSNNIDALCDQVSSIADDEIGASNPALAIASSRHETQYCRIFRS